MAKDKIKPMNDYVIVKQAEAETKTKGGLYVPEIAAQAPLYGKIVAVGPGKIDQKGNRTAMQVKAGDHVYFTKNAFIEVSHNGTEHLMMKEERILLIETK